MRRLVTLVVSLVMAVALFGATAFAGGNPNEWPEGFEHGHAMLIGVALEPTQTEGVFLVHYKKCVEFKALPVMAHHHSIHTGNAGGALFNAGNGVLPLAPLTPFTGCDAIPNPLEIEE